MAAPHLLAIPIHIQIGENSRLVTHWLCLARYDLCCLRYGLPCRLETRPVARNLGSVMTLPSFCLIRGISSQQLPPYCGKSGS
jgi:hypothetical protein